MEKLTGCHKTAAGPDIILLYYIICNYGKKYVLENYSLCSFEITSDIDLGKLGLGEPLDVE